VVKLFNQISELLALLLLLFELGVLPKPNEVQMKVNCALLRLMMMQIGSMEAYEVEAGRMVAVIVLQSGLSTEDVDLFLRKWVGNCGRSLFSLWLLGLLWIFEFRPRVVLLVRHLSLL
jgi:hypothetical protein